MLEKRGVHRCYCSYSPLVYLLILFPRTSCSVLMWSSRKLEIRIQPNIAIAKHALDLFSSIPSTTSQMRSQAPPNDVSEISPTSSSATSLYLVSRTSASAGASSKFGWRTLRKVVPSQATKIKVCDFSRHVFHRQRPLSPALSFANFAGLVVRNCECSLQSHGASSRNMDKNSYYLNQVKIEVEKL